MKGIDILKEEEWVDIIGYDGYYEISSLGRVKSLPRIFYPPNGGEAKTKERILSLRKIGGRLWALLAVDNDHKTCQVATMVAYAFIKKYNNEYIWFKDNNSLNTSIDNLIIVTEKNVLELLASSKMPYCNQVSQLIHNIGLKKCSNCKELKEHRYFSAASRNRGVNNICQDCTNKLVKNYLHKNK